MVVAEVEEVETEMVAPLRRGCRGLRVRFSLYDAAKAKETVTTVVVVIIITIVIVVAETTVMTGM